jgi:hypothetical protein
METILGIPRELESQKSLVKLVNKKHDQGLKSINLTKWNLIFAHALRKI